VPHIGIGQDRWTCVLILQGIEEVKRRLIVAPSAYIIKVIDKDGVRTVKTIGSTQQPAAA